MESPEKESSISLIERLAITNRGLITRNETPPARPQAINRSIMPTIAIGQTLRLTATTEQQVLLAIRFQTQSGWTKQGTVGKHGRTAAAAEQMGLTGFDLADFGEDWDGLFGV